MVDPEGSVSFDGEQAECAGRVRELWAAHAPLEREMHAMRGGIIWKTARGHEYLYRYYQDPLTRTKRFESLGRRSAETEAEHDRFLRRRDRTRTLLAETAPQVETVGRVARAFRLARFPAPAAAIVRGLWLHGAFDDDLRLMGTSAVLSYELEAEFLSPPALVRSEGLHLLAGEEVDDRLADVACAAVAAVDPGLRVVRRDRERLSFQGPRGIAVDLHSRHGLASYLRERGLGRDTTDVVLDAASAPAWQGVAVARDATVLPAVAVDPRACAMLALAQAATERDGGRADLLRRRARLVAWAARERLGTEFDAAQEEAFPALDDDEDEVSLRWAP